MIHFRSIATMILCLVSTGCPQAQELVRPIVVFNTKYQLLLDTSELACVTHGGLRWVPEVPGSINMLVGDSIKLNVQISTNEAVTSIWKGQWKWTTERRCGKDKCITEHEVIQEVPSSFELGGTLKITMRHDESEQDIGTSKTIEDAWTKPGKFLLSATFADFVKPTGSKPHPSATLARDFCAYVITPTISIASFQVKIIRRRR